MKTKNDVVEEIRKMDPNLKEDDIAFEAACFVLASIVVGPSVTRLAHFLNVNMERAAQYGYRLRKARTWRGDKVCANWDDPESGGVEFWMDVNVAMGLMEKR